MDEAHTDDLRNVNEGDEVILETTSGETLDVTCVERVTDHASGAARRAGIIRETTRWHFDLGGEELVAAITDGLAESPDVDLPSHSALYNLEQERGYGYIESLNLVGPDVRGAVPAGQEREQ